MNLTSTSSFNKINKKKEVSKKENIVEKWNASWPEHRPKELAPPLITGIVNLGVN